MDSALLPWIMLPVVGAGIGYATNWLAIKMLFHPRQPRFGLQGLLPRRQDEIAESVGRIVANDLLSIDSLLAKLDDVDLGPSFEKLANSAIERRVEDLRKIPLIGGFITPERLGSITGGLIEELKKSQPAIIAELKKMAQERIDVQALVQERLESFDLMQMEQMVHQVAPPRIPRHRNLGAILGIIIGLVQAGIFTLVAA